MQLIRKTKVRLALKVVAALALATGTAMVGVSMARAAGPSVDASLVDIAASALPMRFRTAYAIGGQDGCETVLSVSNFTNYRVPVEVEFFNGRTSNGVPTSYGIATWSLNANETVQIATSPFAPPYDIEAVRSTTAPFEGYATVHSSEARLGLDAHLVCNIGSYESYSKINVFVVSNGGPYQHGD